jgi:hypothetical protein
LAFSSFLNGLGHQTQAQLLLFAHFKSSSSSDNVLFLFKEKEEEEALPCSVSVCGYVLSFRIHWLIADKKKETKSRRVTV